MGQRSTRPIGSRCFSGTGRRVQGVSRAPEAFVSTSDDPYFNLALEDHLFRSRSTPPFSSKQRAQGTPPPEPAPPLLLLYRNKTCVVIGRNQNPWKEVNVHAMRERAIPLVRRRSGGGTVFHDAGNTNYSIHVSRESFDRATNAHLIARALNNPPIDLASSHSPLVSSRGVFVNERNDICVELASSSNSPAADPHEHASDDAARPPRERKVSGSAYKLVSSRAYHHGTMLLSSDLSTLGAALRNERGEHLSTKGIASVRAKVINLREAFPARRSVLNHEQFCTAVAEEFLRTHRGAGGDASAAQIRYVGEELLDSEPALRASYDELISWDWTYAQTPEFTHQLSTRRHKRNAVASESSSARYKATDAASFAHGDFDLTVHARQGVILSAELSNVVAKSPGGQRAFEQALQAVVSRMKDQRYDDYGSRPPGKLAGAHDEDVMLSKSPARDGQIAQIRADTLQWLKHVL